MEFKNLNDYSKIKLLDDIKKIDKVIEKLTESIKNHNQELQEKRSKLDELEKTKIQLELLKKQVF